MNKNFLLVFKIYFKRAKCDDTFCDVDIFDKTQNTYPSPLITFYQEMQGDYKRLAHY